MSALILLATCLGAVLGTRFKVLILIPAIGVATTFVFASSIFSDQGVAAAVIAAIFLQLGYIASVLTRSRLAPRKAGDLANVSRSA